MPPAERQPRGWPPPLLAALSPTTPTAGFVDQPLAAAVVSGGVHHHHPSLPTHTRRHVPPQYSPGTDGLWRRIESYTLVGATICDTCTVSKTTALRETDDAFFDTIPSGWVRDDLVATPTRTSITVALSVTLAFFIVLTIVRCHFSLRAATRRRKAQEKANAAKRARVEGAASSETLAPKPSPVPKSRKWMARATARWKDNARYLARQRRGRRHSRKSSTDSLVEVKDVADVTIVVAPPTPTPPSPRPSSPSLQSPSSIQSTDETTSEPLPSEAPPEPPAYLSPPDARSRSSKPPAPTMDLRAILAAEPPSTEAEVFPPYTPRPAPDESSSSSGYFGSDVDAASPASSHSHAAHLATDDKNVLARLAERASAPEMRVSAAMTTAAAPLPAAAVAARAPAEDELDYEYHAFEGFQWDSRDEAETEARNTNTNADRDRDRPPRLPSPPPADVTSSGAALEKMQLERAYAARDGAGPSTPPALTFPSPSAPPAFSGEYEYGYSEMAASAPALDDDVDGDCYHEVYPQAGPSTPRQVASAPPMSEEDEDEEQLEYADEEDDQLGEEVGEVFVDREEERRRRSLGKQPERGEAASSREDSPETEARRRESGQRPRPRPRSQVSDTGWDDGGGG